MDWKLRCEDIIAGCVQSHQRFNSSTCCNSYFSKENSIIPHGSCISTVYREDFREEFANNQRGLTFLVKINVADRISNI